MLSGEWLQIVNVKSIRPQNVGKCFQSVLCGFFLGLIVSPDAELGAAVGAAAPADPGPRVVTIREFLDGARGWGETNVLRLRGVVTASLADKTYFLQDGDAGVYVFHRPAEPLAVGDWVEVTGHPSLGNLLPLLDGTAVRGLGTRELPPPSRS
jgi:hypothetical protein